MRHLDLLNVIHYVIRQLLEPVIVKNHLAWTGDLQTGRLLLLLLHAYLLAHVPQLELVILAIRSKIDSILAGGHMGDARVVT